MLSSSTTIIITHHFPLQGGETFLQAEAPYLRTLPGNVIFLPTSPGQMREDSGINFSNHLIRSKFNKLCDIMKTLSYIRFLKEAYINDSPPKNLTSIIRLAHASSSVVFHYKKLKQFILEHSLHKHPLVIYTYWFTHQTYAAFLLKKTYPHIQVITRAHGIDVYPERHKHNYNPLRSFCANWVDAVYPCSKSGFDQLRNSGVSLDKLQISHLGTDRRHTISPLSDRSTIHICSCSSISPVKRLDLLVEQIRNLAATHQDLKFHWTHIGGGQQLSSFITRASLVLSKVANATFQILGQMDHEAIMSFYEKTPITFFVNTSQSEGIPVSIMEVLSFGIPVIATDVGGTSEIVTPATGALIPKDFTSDQFIDAFRIILNMQTYSTRVSITNSLDLEFNSDKNYSKFIQYYILPYLKKSFAILTN